MRHGVVDLLDLAALTDDSQPGLDELRLSGLDRDDARNAQNRGMLVELHEAFMAAEADDTGAGEAPAATDTEGAEALIEKDGRKWRRP